MTDKYTEELARRFKTAFCSHHLRVGMDYYYNKYIGDEPAGEFWHDLAALVLEREREARNESYERFSRLNGKGRVQ